MIFASVVQRGRLEREAAILVTSLIEMGGIAPDHIKVFYPRNGPKWPRPAEPSDALLAFLREKGVEARPIDNEAFGASYPHANRMYAMLELGDGPAAIMDTDMLALGPIEIAPCALGLTRHDKGRPWAAHVDDVAAAWRTIYAYADVASPDNDILVNGEVRCVTAPYYNAGLIVGEDLASFGALWLDTALKVHARLDEIREALRFQRWTLDQTSLPVAVRRSGRTVTPLRPRAFNAYDKHPNTRLWHYHTVMELTTPWAGRIDPRVTKVLEDAALKEFLKDDPVLAFWTGAEGLQAFEEAVAAVGSPLRGKIRPYFNQQRIKLR